MAAKRIGVPQPYGVVKDTREGDGGPLKKKVTEKQGETDNQPVGLFVPMRNSDSLKKLS